MRVATLPPAHSSVTIHMVCPKSKASRTTLTFLAPLVPSSLRVLTSFRISPKVSERLGSRMSPSSMLMIFTATVLPDLLVALYTRPNVPLPMSSLRVYGGGGFPEEAHSFWMAACTRCASWSAFCLVENSGCSCTVVMAASLLAEASDRHSRAGPGPRATWEARMAGK